MRRMKVVEVEPVPCTVEEDPSYGPGGAGGKELLTADSGGITRYSPSVALLS